ncbi:MAG: hypothetical protein IPK83_21685, partial [Planctomycetes bacterium]|nr:hypothetical protein [Planctomycetota bacterium]
MDYYFSEALSTITRALRRSRLARVLRFYAEKARRHRLDDQTFDRLSKEIDKLLTQGAEFKVATQGSPHRVYVFCPEADDISRIAGSGEQEGVQAMVFGPGRLPDLATRSLPTAPIEPGDSSPTSLQPEEKPLSVPEQKISMPDVMQVPDARSDGGAVAEDQSEVDTDSVQIILGRRSFDKSEVAWSVSIAANPHLMLAGLPGMGKTTCLINICQHLMQQNIVPIVFSFHQDIDEKLGRLLGDMRMLEHDQLGFNPMQIDSGARNAHIDSAGMLRDIFSAIFPELGDIQTERIRQAIKESYVRAGWGGAA